MVDISHETAGATDARLHRVIRAAELKVYDALYAFEEFALDDFPERVDPDALALVRDDEVWSQLAPASSGSQQTFAIFRFHFPPGVDNSGFVGWLATRLKRRFGTGLFVICGQNSSRGGVFDYWGCPAELRTKVLGDVRALVGATAENT